MSTSAVMPEAPSIPDWQGVHHLALATPDLEATVRFYCGGLGMRLLLTRRSPDGQPHLFIDAGGGATLHFWQAPAAEIFTQPPARRGVLPGALQHLSFRLPDEAALAALQARLRLAGIEVSDIIEQAPVRFCIFMDNNGIQLEAACWLDDLTARPVNPADPALFADPDPAPAVIALLAGGDLFPTPTPPVPVPT